MQINIEGPFLTLQADSNDEEAIIDEIHDTLRKQMADYGEAYQLYPVKDDYPKLTLKLDQTGE